jgi:uncharacterized protein
MRRHALWVLAGLLGLCSACREANDGPRYLLWRVDGPASHVYLLGSVHVLRAGEHVQSRAIEAAYRASAGLVMELDFDDLDDHALGTMMTSKATDGGGLAQNLGDDDYRRALDEAERLGLDLEPLSDTEPWFAGLAITDMALDKLGYDAAHGVEADFTRRARADGKAITGLETPEFQIGLLDALPPEQQRELLFQSLKEAGQLPALLDPLLDAWKRGDEAALKRELETGFAGFPDLYRTLISERNARWVPQIAALLATPQDHLVIVGALHLVGEHSVISALRRRGYRVRRL